MQLKLPSVPAYSIPKTGRDRWGDELKTPGPGQYDEDKYGELSTYTRRPRATINKAGISSSQDKDYHPGPADYDTNRSSLSKRGQYIIGSAKREGNSGNMSLPGPGAYETSVSSLKKQGVAPVKTGRESGSYAEVPGPGNYDTNRSSLTKRGIAALKGQGHGDLYRKDQLPGPLDYDPYSYEEKSKSKTGIKIPVSGRNNKGLDNIPGPASYDTNYSSLNKKGYAVAKTGRNIFGKDDIPGPGNYETSVSSLSRRGLARLAPPRISPIGNALNPGPTDYDPYGEKSNYRKGLTIPKSGRRGFDSEFGPGPAAYNSAEAFDKMTLKRGAGFAPVKASSHANLDNTPGPAYYNVPTSSLTKKGQAIIPKSGKEGSLGYPTPGPADYESSKIFEKEWKRGVTIPHAGKNPKTDYGTPGPGQYDHITSVPDVAPYLLTKKK